MAWGLLYKFVLANLAYKVMSLVMAKNNIAGFGIFLCIWNIYVL